MRTKIIAFLLILMLLFGAGYPTRVLSVKHANWEEKVDPALLAGSPTGGTEFIVYLTDQADLAEADNLNTKREKGHYVYQQLVSTARRSQGSILNYLTSQGVEHQPFWVANMIWVRAGGQVLQNLASREEVDHIYANPQVHLVDPIIDTRQTTLQSAGAPEWNIQQIHAPEVWAAGFLGEGITVGGQDTGIDWDHPALKDQYRGWDGDSVDHNYNWHDAIHESTGNPCGSDIQEPCDDHALGHGTHTMGTMVGRDDNLGVQIGVAPGAKWIGCRNMDQGVGSPATYAECYQWFLAPTDLNDLNPDPTRAPDVINNSWSCPTSEGCAEPEVLLEVVEAVRAAGILTVHSAGNSGPACGSVNTPAAIYEASFTVGNTDQNDQVAISSSRGPVLVDGSGRIKPDVAAPGTNIRSSLPGESYGILSGTSMAGPHVAGLAALMLSANPELVGKVNLIERLITRTAVPTGLNSDCGGIPGSSYPNNSSGWGRVDALNALSYGRIELFLPVISRE